MLAIEKTADFTEQESERVIELFLTSKSWDTRHRQIMLLSKQLPRMPVNLRSQENLINGCESLAWLQLKQDQQGRYTFSADSDAKIIRGLLVIILAAFNNKTAKEITQFDLNKYFSTLGLMQHLSPSRGNGVRAIVDKIIKGVSSQTL
jgi:cysteine desulfurase/selenocysteine lyase